MIHKSPKLLVTSFSNYLSWSADVKKVDILLGDFNIDTQCNGAFAGVHNAITEYVLMVTDSTQLDDEYQELLRQKYCQGFKHVDFNVENNRKIRTGCFY